MFNATVAWASSQAKQNGFVQLTNAGVMSINSETAVKEVLQEARKEGYVLVVDKQFILRNTENRGKAFRTQVSANLVSDDTQDDEDVDQETAQEQEPQATAEAPPTVEAPSDEAPIEESIDEEQQQVQQPETQQPEKQSKRMSSKRPLQTDELPADEPPSHGLRKSVRSSVVAKKQRKMVPLK